MPAWSSAVPSQPRPARGRGLRGVGVALGGFLLASLAAAVLLVLIEAHYGARDEKRMWLSGVLLPPQISARARAKLRARPVSRATTIVTGFFEIPNGGSLRERFDGTPYVLTSDRYWQWARRVLSFRAPMVVFTTRGVAQRVRSFRGELGLRHVTHIVVLDARAWLGRPEFAMMRELLVERGLDRSAHSTVSALRLQPVFRTIYSRVPPWALRAVGIKWSADIQDPQATDLALPRERVARAAARAARRPHATPLPAESALAAHWSKVFWTREAIQRDPFGSDNFVWVDWGLLRGDRRDDVFMHRVWPGPRAVRRFAENPRVHVVQYSCAFNAICRPPADPGRAAPPPTFGISAGAFGGAKVPLSRALDLFVEDLWADLRRGILVEEETTMTRVAKSRPDLFQCANPLFPLVVPRPHYSCVTSFMV